MTEGKLDPAAPKGRKFPLWAWIAAIGLVSVAGLWLVRQPLAEGIGKAFCAGKGLTCALSISRLDFGGVTLKKLTVTGPSAHTPPLTADEIAVDLAWSSPFAPRASTVGGKNIALRLDLTGHRPLLGDLDKTVQEFLNQPASNAPAPKVRLENVKLIADTPLGPVEANGQAVVTGPDSFTIDLAATPVHFSAAGSELDLRGAELHATAAGATIKGSAKLDLKRLVAPGASAEDLKLDITLDQLEGVLKSHGSATAAQVALKQGAVQAGNAGADVEAAAIDLKKPPGSWVAGLRKFKVDGTAGAGSAQGAAWTNVTLSASLDPRDGGGAGGDFAFSVDHPKHAWATADKLEIGGKLDLPSGFTEKAVLSATGVARLRTAALTKASADNLAAAITGSLGALMPAFGAAAAKTVRSAGQSFDVVLPFSASVGEAAVAASVLSGAELKAGSGLSAVLDGNGKPEVVRWTSGEASSWAAAGSLWLAGGGGPQLSLDLAQAQGAGTNVSAAAAVDLRAWRIGDDTLTAKASGLSLETNGKTGKAAGQVVLSADGAIAGGIWSKAQASGGVTASWSDTAFIADAPGGLAISWDKGKYGDTVLGAGALRYTPKGHLAERSGAILSGEGTLGALDIPITGPSYAARARLAVTNINWNAGDVAMVAFNAGAPSFSFAAHDTPAPNTAGSLTGVATLSDGWRVAGAIDGAHFKADQADLNALKAKFDLGGKNGSLSGSVSDVSLDISDPSTPDKRVFEAAKFVGSAKVTDNLANFTGLFTLAKSGVQIATVNGTHSLKTGSGSLTFPAVPLIFQPGGFEPTALSPILRGPANVEGRIDISGSASWTSVGVKTNATVELKKLGFALASAGVFEGVSGKAEINDVLKMTSAPNQTITIDKVTLGLPIEKGTIHFQLIGLDAVRLQGAEWPFVGGFIRVRPIDFTFAGDKNTIVAQAVDWDMAQLGEQFKLKDIKIQGQIAGDFPVTFSTGSATVDKALLKASSSGGVIQYTGSTGDAAGQSDSNAKMLFDALKDFHYSVLEAELNGDLAGRMVLALTLEGRNPAVLSGQVFKTNISIDSELMNLLNTTGQATPEVNALIGKITHGTPN